MSSQIVGLQAADQSNKLNTILEISRRLMSLKQETRPAAILEQLQSVIEFNGAVLFLFGSDNSVEHTVAGPFEQMQALEESGLWSHLSPEIITRREPFIIDDIWRDDSPSVQQVWPIFSEIFAGVLRPGAAKAALQAGHSFLGIPLIVEQTVTGLIGLWHHQPGFYRPEHANIGLAFGYQVAMALANEQLFQRARNLAILEERDRLSRELHDNLAQTLGYLNLRLAEATQRLNSGEAAGVQEILSELKQLVSETYTDVREEIFNLRTSKSRDQNFLDSLREYTAKYRLHYKLDINLSIPADESLLQLAPNVGSQLMRIIQEALINVRKHTTETAATVRLTAAGDQIQVSIEDSGCGFNPDGVLFSATGGLGLQIMRERAESIGGVLTVESAESKGTKIIVAIPAAGGI